MCCPHQCIPALYRTNNHFLLRRYFIEKVEAKLNSREKDAEAMRVELDFFQQRKVAWDNDREELNSQIVILTEER